MPRLLANLFEKVDEAFHDLVDKADADPRHQSNLTGMRLFRAQRAGIESRFLSALAARSGALTQGPAVRWPGADARSASRVPMPGVEREEDLVYNNLVSKAESRYRAELAAIRDRVRPGADTDLLGPVLICEAFRSALPPMEGIDLSIKLSLYKIFDKQVMDGLGGLYARCLGQAVDPSIRGASAAQPGPSRDDGHSRGQPDLIARDDERAGLQPVGEPGFQYLRTLLQQRRTKAAKSPDAVPVETTELLFLLSGLEHQVASGGVQDVHAERLRKELRERGGVAASRTLVGVDEDTLDLVFLLFENILQGNDLPNAIKALIARLQIPITKVALADKSFFDHKHHPARRFLNHLAQSALGWVDEGERAPGGVYGRIKEAVERVLADRGADSRVFEDIDGAFTRQLAQERGQALTNEAQVCRELEEKEHRQGDQAVVRDVIDARLSAYDEVPEVVTSLIHEGWEQVMRAALMNGGLSGRRWRNALAALDRLLWSVTPKVADEDRRELLRGIPELLRSLRESLAGIDYDQRLLAARFRELQALHIAALRRVGAEERTTTNSPGRKRDLSGKGGRESEQAHAAPGPSSEPTSTQSAAPDFPVGTWFEVRRGDGLIRVKLAWRGARSATRLFVDRRGRKALELSPQDLADLLEQGAVKVVCEGDSHLVDRAMETLVHTLKSA